jgi:phosphopantothenoylcysteine decarboxylase/phosphopantothenate--cysteine ligase
VATLVARDIIIWGPGAGEQACGDVGLGRMLDVPELVDLACQYYDNAQNIEHSLSGQHWVITAGPTREAIDPVRYISNHSSGKMGYAIAKAAQQAGALVTIISGPVTIIPPKDCKTIKVTSALDMHQHALQEAKGASVFVACAAVADYRVSEIAQQKIKKSSEELQLNLVKNPDIVADVAALTTRPFTVGFAAETQDLKTYALGKLQRKNLDMIAANNVAIAGQGFNSDHNALTVFSKTDTTEFTLATKEQLAQQLVALINRQQTISE